MINRRNFLATSILSAAAASLSPPPMFRKAPREESERPESADFLLTIIHTNDTHSQIDPISANDKRNAGKGGVARRATLIKRVRKENPNTLLIDAGDVLQGTPYFNFYKGEVEYKAMSAMGYDASTLGNHEFDNGVGQLAAALKFANFDIVSSNYDVKGTALEGRVKPYVVKKVGPIRVGLFGLGISPTALITPENFKGITYNDPVIVSRQMVKLLKQEQHCDLIVCMSHLGFYRTLTRAGIGDSQLAAQVDGIDFIASGHSHTFMQEPVKQAQPCGAETLIFQVGKSGIYLGRVDFTFRAGKVASASGSLLNINDESARVSPLQQ